jgi:hypothetical protein
MDGHWEWPEGGEDADTADLSGDGGHDLHGDYAEDYGADYGDTHAGFGGEEHDLGGHHGDDELEEPLGTEHAAAEYDQALHDATGDAEHAGPPSVEDAAEHHPAHGGHDTVFGADPDVPAGADDPAWHEPQFPPDLQLQDPPEPVDGFPWSDADVLGGPEDGQSAAFDPAVAGGDAEPAGLADYAGVDVPPGTDAWSLLLGSDDPAAGSLAAFWAPQ